MKMTVKEVADALGVSYSSVDRAIDKLFPDKKRNGIVTVLSVSEVTEIKNKLQSHHNLFSTEKVTNAITIVDKMETIQRALVYSSEMLAEKDKIIEALTPKAIAYDSFMKATNAQPVGDVAKVFGIGRNRLFQLLRDAGILQKGNVPYQEYMHYFEVVEKPVVMGEKVENKTVTLVKPNGVDYLMRRLEIKQKSFGDDHGKLSSRKSGELQ